MNANAATSGYNHLEDKNLSLRLDECIQSALTHKALNLCGAVIKGHSGTGKTFFVENYLQKFETVHPILIARHNQQQESIPYAGFRHCISDFLVHAYKDYDKEKFKYFSLSLKDFLGENFHLLCDYIPELELLSGKGSNDSFRSSPGIENQLYPLIKVLFGFLSDFYNKPLLFFTDDLQYMDASGMNLLKYLLLHLSPHKLIWIGAFREPQRNQLQINELIESLNLNKKYIENISIKEFTLSHGHYFMEKWLGGACTPKLTTLCYKLSEANLSQLQVLVESLKKEKLIYVNNNLWEGDYNQILNRYRGQNVYKILQESLFNLSQDTQEMLCLISCMGGFSRKILMEHFQENESLYEACINEAVQSGLLVSTEKGFYFSESHIGEMIYEKLNESQKSHYHYRIAQLIYQRQGSRLSYSKQIMMTSHFNQSLDLVRLNREQAICAALNFSTGCVYKQDHAFSQAKIFFKISADLYKECPWDKVKDKLWKVYLERAKVEYALGEYDLAEIHLDYLLDRFSDPVQRADAFELKVTINNHWGRYRKAVTILKGCLLELGIELPLEERIVLQEISLLKSRLTENGKSAGSLDALPSSEKQKAILKLLSVGGMSLHHTSDILMTWAALQIIIRSQYTQSGVRSIGYVSYGRMEIISGDIQKGFESGSIGLNYNISQEDLQYRCRVFGVFAFYIQPWKKAFLASTPLLQQGMQAGRETGDLIGLYILKTHQFNLHFISGRPIKELLQYDFEESYPGRELTYYITHYQKNLVKFLTGEVTFFSIPRQQPSMLAANLTIREEKFYRNHVWARYYFMFGYYDLAVQYGKEAHQNKKLQEGSPLVPSNLLIIFLSITQNWHHWSESKKPQFLKELKEILTQVDLWSHHAPINYAAMRHLFYGEWHRIQETTNRKTVDHFIKSIAHAGNNLYLKALAHELLAKYYLGQTDQIAEGKFHLDHAIKQYNLWEGTAKSRQLIQQYHFLLTDSYPQKQEMDIEAILRELSGDLQFDSLVKKLMVLLLRVSGSTRVVIEWMENKGEFKGIECKTLLGSNDKEELPAALMLMTQRTKELFLVNDLQEENVFSEVSLLHEQGIKSFLILPLTLSDRFSMTIYLENTFATRWYQNEKIKWIRITANQGGIVIENARTHERTVKLNEKLQHEMAEKQLLVSQIESQKDAHLKDLEETQENERKRIAGDLHDSLGSLLSSIKLRFNGIQERSLLTNPEQKTYYADTLAQIDEAVEEVRRIAHNMSPVSLKRFGLGGTLQTLIDQINISNQLDAELQLLGLEERLPEQLELTVYRICQELVQNVIKHSHGTFLHLQIIKHPDMLNIMVEDNGVGMNVKGITAGFGFGAIQTKVRLFKGNFSIESQPGKGCTAIVDIPCILHPL